MSRTAEFILGFMGGLIGIGVSAMTGILGGITTALSPGHSEAFRIMIGGEIALMVSVISCVGSMFIWKAPKISGSIMIASAFIGIVSAFIFYALPFTLLLTGGLLAVLRKEKVSLNINNNEDGYQNNKI